MSFYNSVFHKGIEYRYVYTDPNPSVSEEISTDLSWHVVDMMIAGEGRREIKNSSYEGVIKRDGRIRMGFITGHNFLVEVNTDKGKRKNCQNLLWKTF